MALRFEIPFLDAGTELALSKIAFRTVFGDALILGLGLTSDVRAGGYMTKVVPKQTAVLHGSVTQMSPVEGVGVSPNFGA